MKVFKHFRANFTTGIFILIPVAATLYIVFRIFVFLDSMLPAFIHAIIPQIPIRWVPGLGILFIILISYSIGLAAKNYFGRVIIDTGNAIVSKIPLVNKIYLGVQQIIDSVSLERKKLFDKVVLVEFPHKHSYSLGFLTSTRTGEVAKKLSPDIVSVFVPQSPPVGGFLIYVPRSEIIELDMNAETAIKTIISAGLVSSEQFRRTDHLYRLPKQLKNWNWTKIFDKTRKYPNFDPRD